MLLDKKDQVYGFDQEHSIWSGSVPLFFLSPPPHPLFLWLSPCLLPHLYYYINVSAEHTQSPARYNSHHTNYLTVTIPAPFMRSATNYS